MWNISIQLQTVDRVVFKNLAEKINEQNELQGGRFFGVGRLVKMLYSKIDQCTSIIRVCITTK